MADKSVSVPTDSSPRTNEGDGCNLDAIGENINNLVMWKDASKSTLWFRFGSLCLLSSCFAEGVNFSIFSFLSQLGLLFLGVSFFRNSIRQRDAAETELREDDILREDDVLRIGRLILPAANLAISKTRQVFSGEPAMTLKVLPILFVGAEYGHLITLWRLFALGFFISFTAPKLYSDYSSQISKKVEYLKSFALDSWQSCEHKKIVAALGVMGFWNLTSIGTKIFAAFLCLVMLRYHRQNSLEEEVATEEKQEVQEQERSLCNPVAVFPRAKAGR